MKSQWSLIIFTLLIQLAVGSIIIVSVINSQIFNKNVDSFPHEITIRLLMVILMSLLVAVISSFFHLGNPLNAHLSLNNLASSWLSREILLVILFSTSILTYFLFEIMSLSNQHIRLTIAIIGLLLGLALVISMSKLYMIETVPAWNTLFTPAKFLMTTTLLGITAFLLILVSSDYSGVVSPRNSSLIKSILQLALILLFTELLLFLIELWTLNSGELTKLVSFKLITIENRFTFFVNLLLFASSILFILYKLFNANNSYSAVFLILISVLIILLQITQRYLVYASYNRIGI